MEINTSANASRKQAASRKAKRLAPIDVACRLAVAPALLIAPFVAIERAAAACDPATPVNGANVTCTGTTGSSKTGVGYGDPDVSPNSITVQSGASVTGSFRGLQFNDGTTVNNFGTITAGDGGAGISADGTANVTGSGKITAGARGAGIVADSGDANVTGSSAITVA